MKDLQTAYNSGAEEKENELIAILSTIAKKNEQIEELKFKIKCLEDKIESLKGPKW